MLQIAPEKLFQSPLVKHLSDPVDGASGDSGLHAAGDLVKYRKRRTGIPYQADRGRFQDGDV